VQLHAGQGHTVRQDPAEKSKPASQAGQRQVPPPTCMAYCGLTLCTQVRMVLKP
jgi:hypothetical protein